MKYLIIYKSKYSFEKFYFRNQLLIFFLNFLSNQIKYSPILPINNQINQPNFSLFKSHRIHQKQMSFLFSTQITRQNKHFLNRLDRQYQKRITSSLSTYKPKHKSDSTNPIKDQTQELDKKWNIANSKMLEIMKNFIFDMKQVLDQIQDQSKFYKALKFMKDHQFFWDVSSMINTQIAKNNHTLQSQLQTQKSQIVKLRKHQLNKKSEIAQFQQPQKHKNKQKAFDTSRSVSENLYYRAKTMQQGEFIIFCQNILMKDKIIIKNISTPRQNFVYPRKQIQNKQVFDLTANLQKIQNVFEQLKNQVQENRQQSINLLKEEILKIVQNQVSNSQCDKPCCKFSRDANFTANPTKASIIMSSTESKKFKQVYKNDKSEEYFKRYYRKGSFDMQKVTSVQKTKVEQMQKLQKQYQRKAQMRKKYSYYKGK